MHLYVKDGKIRPMKKNTATKMRQFIEFHLVLSFKVKKNNIKIKKILSKFIIGVFHFGRQGLNDLTRRLSGFEILDNATLIFQKWLVSRIFANICHYLNFPEEY